MSDNRITINFAYWNDDHDELKASHKQAFDISSRFNISTSFISGVFGTVEILTNDVPDITNMSHIEQYEYDAEYTNIDMMYAPLVKYVLKEPQYLKGGDTHPDDVADNKPLEQLIELVITGYQSSKQKPAAVYAETPEHDFYIHKTGRSPFTAKSLAHDQYHHLSWLTVFTPPMVEHYGRETLLSAPAWKVEELDDGAILVVCHDDVDEWQTDCHDVAEHIGLPWYTEIE